MKRLYIAIAFLVISIGLCIFEQYTVEDAYKTTTECIDTAMVQLENKDYRAVEKSCRELAEYWDKKHPYMTAMIDHGALDDTGITINSLKELSKKKSDELEAQLITAKNQIKTVRDNQKITFGNIF